MILHETVLVTPATRWVCPKCGASSKAPGLCSDGSGFEATQDDLLGASIGSYRIATLINASGMGRVYKAVQPSIGARVAVKVLSAEFAGSKDLVERFFAEARAVNIIQHEQIINIIDLASLPDGRPYIVMEYLDGTTLADVMAQYRQCPAGSFSQLMIDVLDALAAAHDHGIIHRDIKPSNIIVSPQGRPKVLDFGIAKLHPDLGGHLTATNPGQIMGTPAYMAPEQATASAVDARTDTYAMGVILYEGVTGQVPFQGESIFGVLHQHLERQPRPPSELRPSLPKAYDDVILQALAKDPVARFQTAREMAIALGEAARALPLPEWMAIRPQAIATASTVPAAITPPQRRPASEQASPVQMYPAAPPADATRSRPVAPTPGPATGRIVAGLAMLAAAGLIVFMVTRQDRTLVPEVPVRVVGPGPADAIPVSTTVVNVPPPIVDAPAPELRPSRTDENFLLNFMLAEPPDELAVKLPGQKDFHSTGMNPNVVDPSTGAPLATTWVTLPLGTGRAQIEVKYRRQARWYGPFSLAFDPDEIALREAHAALEAIPRWVDLQTRNHRQTISFASLDGYRSGLKAIRYGFDEDQPSSVLRDGELRHEVPKGARFVTYQVVFGDGSESPVRRLDLVKGTSSVGPPPLSLATGVDECDSIFSAMAACYQKTMTPDDYKMAATGLGRSAATIRESLTRGMARDEVVKACHVLLENYRELNKGRGCEL